MPPKSTGTARPPSRPKRLATMEKEARALASDYQVWLDTLPENLAESEMAACLAQAIETLETVADELADIDPPRVGKTPPRI